MKKSLPYLIIALLITSVVFGQSKKVNLGIEGGPSLTVLWGNDLITDYGSLTTGFSGGATFQYNFTKRFSLRTNLSFERKGSISTLQITDGQGTIIGETTFRNNFNYITLPILARGSFGDKVKFIINAGPYVGFLIKETLIQEAFNEYPETKTNYTDYYKPLDFGLTTGIGFTLPITGDLLLSMEFRSNFGLYNIAATGVYQNGLIITYSSNLLFGISYQLGENIISDEKRKQYEFQYETY